jgi:hypothetical protein
MPLADANIFILLVEGDKIYRCLALRVFTRQQNIKFLPLTLPSLLQENFMCVGVSEKTLLFFKSVCFSHALALVPLD